MKKLLFILLFPVAIFSQTVPVLTSEGVESVVTEVDTLSANYMYNKTIDWVNVTYSNPDHVLKASIPNEMLRINAFQQGFFAMKGFGTTYYDISYYIEFHFKEGRYKFDFVVTDRTSGGQQLLFSEKSFFKKKDGSLKTNYNMAFETFNQSLKYLYLSHYNYITGQSSDKGDW